mmetsp:Transcript_26306/g.44789  ORF Transcript_26306/g.44789 Transcript_26306/m.44789 type:complete len:81 (-) Transcript_26306:1455-1697(-)
MTTIINNLEIQQQCKATTMTTRVIPSKPQSPQTPQEQPRQPQEQPSTSFFPPTVAHTNTGNPISSSIVLIQFDNPDTLPV